MAFFRTPCLALTLAGSLALPACSDNPSSQPAEADRPVLVTTAHYGSEQQISTFVATIRPRVESDFGFRIGGQVASRQVEVGQTVHSGDVLARLDETDLRLQREQVAAELAAADQASEQTGSEERRSAELRKSGWTSVADLDRAHTTAQEAHAAARGPNRPSNSPRMGFLMQRFGPTTTAS